MQDQTLKRKGPTHKLAHPAQIQISSTWAVGNFYSKLIESKFTFVQGETPNDFKFNISQLFSLDPLPLSDQLPSSSSSSSSGTPGSRWFRRRSDLTPWPARGSRPPSGSGRSIASPATAPSLISCRCHPVEKIEKHIFDLCLVSCLIKKANYIIETVSPLSTKL